MRARLSCFAIAAVVLQAAGAGSEPIDLSLPSILYGDRVLGASLAIRDLDADGRDDLVTARRWLPEPDAESRTIIEIHRDFGSGMPVDPHHYDLGHVSWGLGVLGWIDLNADGLQDLVIEDREQTRLIVFRAQSDGEFDPPQIHSLSNLYVRNVATGDMEGDGDVDLIAAGDDVGNNYLRFYRNLGDGTLEFARLLSFRDTDIGTIAMGDLNGDGRHDIALSKTSTYLPNVGNGLFGIPVDYGVSAEGRYIRSRDLEGDGDLDLVVIGGSVQVLSNNGMGHFTAGASYASAAEFGILDVDLNHDGRLDLAIADYETTSVLLDEGNGTFAVSQYPGVGGSSIRSGEFNRDGWLDLTVTNGPSLTPLLSQNAPAYVVGKRLLLVTGGSGSPFDVDRGGDADLLTSSGTPYGIGVIDCKGDGTFAGVEPVNLGTWTLASSLADFDRDGSDDLLLPGNSTSKLLMGCTREVHEVVLGSSNHGPLWQVAVGDVSGDGWLDLIVARTDFASGAVSVLFGLEGGTSFAPPTDYALGAHPTSVVSGDFDGDGLLDFISNGWSTSALWFRNTGGGVFASPVYIDVNSTRALGAADFDGDDRLDLLVGGTKVFFNQGGGAWTGGPFLAGGEPFVIADLDDSGRPDIVANSGSWIRALLNNGDGSFRESSFPSGGGWSSIAIADFDGSGSLDVVMPHAMREVNQSAFVVLSNQGNASFEVAHDRSVTPLAGPNVAFDWDCDGRLDVLTPSAVFLNRTGTRTPLSIESFHGIPVASGVELRWRLAAGLTRELRRIHVLRSPVAIGPFTNLTPGGLEPSPAMLFLDMDGALPFEAWYRLRLVFTNGTIAESPAISASTRLPEDTALRSVRSTPDAIEVRYSVGRRGLVGLRWFDVRGRLVRTLVNASQQPGEYLEAWDGTNAGGTPVAQGVYFLRFSAAGMTAHRKAILRR